MALFERRKDILPRSTMIWLEMKISEETLRGSGERLESMYASQLVHFSASAFSFVPMYANTLLYFSLYAFLSLSSKISLSLFSFFLWLRWFLFLRFSRSCVCVLLRFVSLVPYRTASFPVRPAGVRRSLKYIFIWYHRA